VEDYIDFLVENDRFDEAAKWLVKTINNDQFVSVRGRSVYQLWTQLCDIVCQHPEHMKSIRVEHVVRAGIKRFTDQVGRLWNALAKYWILLGNLEKVRFYEHMNLIVG
jgi:pre-mRNA-splicing factor SYF1